MKAIILITLLVAVCLADYSEKQREQLKVATSFCVKDLGIAEDSDLPRKFMYGELKEKDDVIKKFIACTMKKLNFINDEGTVLDESLVEFLAEKYDRQQATDVIEKCSKLKKETVEDKANEFYDCFFQQKSFDI